MVYGPLEVIHSQGECDVGLSHKEKLKRDFSFSICISGSSAKQSGELQQISYDKNYPVKYLK